MFDTSVYFRAMDFSRNRRGQEPLRPTCRWVTDADGALVMLWSSESSASLYLVESDPSHREEAMAEAVCG